MKKLLALSFILFLSFTCSAQYEMISQKNKNAIKTQTLEVVLTGDKVFDDAVASALKSEWNVSDYTFIGQVDFDNKYQKGDPVVALIKGSGKMNLQIAGLYLKDQVFFGIVSSYQLAGEYEDADTATDIMHIDDEGLSLVMKLRLYLRSVNNDSIRDRMDSDRTRKAAAEGKLLLIPDWQYQSSLAEIKEFYNYRVELADKKRIEEAISNKEDVVLGLLYYKQVDGPAGNQGANYHHFILASDGTTVMEYVEAIWAKKNPEKLKGELKKGEKAVLKEYARVLKLWKKKLG